MNICWSVILLSCECQVNRSMVSQYWFSEWLGTIRQNKTLPKPSSWDTLWDHQATWLKPRYFLEFEPIIFDVIKRIHFNLVTKEERPKASQPVLLRFESAIGITSDSWMGLPVYVVTGSANFHSMVFLDVCKTAWTPLWTHWSYCSLALISHPFILPLRMRHEVASNVHVRSSRVGTRCTRYVRM